MATSCAPAWRRCIVHVSLSARTPLHHNRCEMAHPAASGSALSRDSRSRDCMQDVHALNDRKSESSLGALWGISQAFRASDTIDTRYSSRYRVTTSVRTTCSSDLVECGVVLFSAVVYGGPADSSWTVGTTHPPWSWRARTRSRCPLPTR